MMTMKYQFTTIVCGRRNRITHLNVNNTLSLMSLSQKQRLKKTIKASRGTSRSLPPLPSSPHSYNTTQAWQASPIWDNPTML